jgi:hypothetical protein
VVVFNDTMFSFTRFLVGIITAALFLQNIFHLIS